ncbi:DNA-processing protein DprA [Bacteroidia bacterium]|nr:DNA-processing protein DprA [Bacteroidia bacterium]
MLIKEPNCEALLTLSNLHLVGNINAKTLLSYCGSAEAVLSEKKSALIKIPGINETIAKSIIHRQTSTHALKELAFMEKHNIRMLPYFDAYYPKRLKQIADSPLYLFVKGPMDLNSQRFVAMIGTRKNTLYGTQMTEQLVAGLKKYNVNIISGLAYGIDGIAHAKANATRSPNCAVLAHGLDTIYPKKHYSLAQEIINTGGVLVTEHLSKTSMHPNLFPRRNRIVAGMSDACIVVESGIKGGSMITAGISQKYNRTVFAIPGKKSDSMSIGCNQLIKSGQAMLCESAEDIAKVMKWDRISNHPSSQIELFKELGENQKLIIDLLQSKILSFDKLLILSQIPMGKLTTLLLEMEMEGLIQGLQGNSYTAVLR